MPVVTIVGAGVIGASWARLFAESGWDVRVSHPRPDPQGIVEKQLADFAVTVTSDLAAAVDGADFVQEAGPERISIKHDIFGTLAANTRDDVVLASSSSSLLPSQIAAGSTVAHRIVIGHPFNPPDLIPLVEVVPGPATSARTLERAVEVYRSLGQYPITLKREFPGFVGDRLQRVVNEQASYLVQQGVIDARDLDELVKTSLGLRWATIGPFESRHLGGGPGGIRQLLEGIPSQMTFEIGEPDPTQMAAVIEQVEHAYGTGAENYERRCTRRDCRAGAILEALSDLEGVG
jgi:ketoreductase RED1